MIFFVGPLIAFAATLLLVLILRPVATRAGLVDIPNARSSHETPTPLIGGIAIFVAFCVGGLVALTSGLLPLDSYSISLLVGSTLMVVVGAMDDAHDLSPLIKFVAQIVASLVMIYGGGVVLTDLGGMLPSGDTLYLGILSVPFTVFATLGVINALNMCDGLDGLSGSLALISLTGMMIVATVNGGPADAIVLAVLAAAIAGFLVFNLRFLGRKRAAIFMGDAGSMLLGFLLTWFAISLSQGQSRAMVPAAALWFLMLPIFDTVAMMLRRIARRQSPFRADREHMHHIFLLAGFSVNETVTIMAAAALIGVGIGLLFMDLAAPEFSIAGFFLIAGMLYFWMVLRSWKVMRFIERSICRRRGGPDRRSGKDRRQAPADAYTGGERRYAADRRQRLRRESDRVTLSIGADAGGMDQKEIADGR